MARKKSGRKERVFYIAMNDEEREITRENMKKLHTDYNLTMSEVLRTVMIKNMTNKDFLDFIGVLK